MCCLSMLLSLLLLQLFDSLCKGCGNAHNNFYEFYMFHLLFGVLLECLQYCKGLITVRPLSSEDRKWHVGIVDLVINLLNRQDRQCLHILALFALCLEYWGGKRGEKQSHGTGERKNSLSRKAETSQISVWGLRDDNYCDPCPRLPPSVPGATWNAAHHYM